MAKKYLILFFICLFSCVMGYFEPEPKIKIEVQKESPAFDKINAIQCILNSRSDESFSDSKLKNEDNVDRKLDFLQKQISELKDILMVAELKRISDLEENVKLILDLVQKISKIEDRFSEKLDPSEKKLMSKLSDLEKIPALEPTTKTVENIGKIPECVNKTNSQLEYLEKFPEFQENINRTLYSIEKVSESTEKLNHKLDLLTKRVTESDKNTNEKLGAIEKIFEPIEQINRKLDALNNKILPELEENVTSTMNIIEEVRVSTDRSNHALYSLVNKMPELNQNINGTLVIIETSAESSENVDDLEKEVPDFEIKVDKNLDLSSYNPSADHADCKEYPAKSSSYEYDSFHTIDNETLRNVALEKDNDKIKFFKMHIAIKTAEAAAILMSPIPKPSQANNDFVFEIGVGTSSNKFTVLKTSMKSEPVVKYLRTTDILSATRYINFYIKISNDTLTFGKEADSTPLLTYEDSRVNTIKYFAFSHWSTKEAKIFFDCPAP